MYFAIKKKKKSKSQCSPDCVQRVIRIIPGSVPQEVEIIKGCLPRLVIYPKLERICLIRTEFNIFKAF